MSTVLKALQLLDLFSRARPQIGLSELARLAGLNKATCFRLMSDLCEAGLAEQVESSKEYRLGPALMRLAVLREAHVPLRDAAIPVLQALAAKIGETAHLSLLQAGELRPLAHAYSNAHSSRVTLEDMEVFPFHATSSGLAVLAFSPPAFREQVLARPLSARTKDTLTDPAELRGKLREIEALGYAESVGSYEPDLHSIAVPVFDALGRCNGALSVAALASRVSQAQSRRIRETLTHAAPRLITLLGGTTPARLEILWKASEPLAKEPT